ncbi:MAG: LysE family translocator [Rhodomicrobiaceae bacterium]
MLIEFLPPLLIPFVITCLIIELTPGPNMGYLALVSATAGQRAGLATTAGVALGLLIIGIAAALGLAALISNSPFLYQALRWSGIFYLLWLAWEGWHGESETSAGNTNVDDNTNEEYAKYFFRGLITNLLNPKAGLFYVVVLPGFVDSSTSVTGQLILLSIIYVMIASAIHAAIVILAGSFKQLLDNPDQSRIIRRSLSLILAGIALWFGWSTRI